VVDGVWERSPAAGSKFHAQPGLLEISGRALPDFSAEDNVGSPYCVRRYVVDDTLAARRGSRQPVTLSQSAASVSSSICAEPLAPDHPWVVDHPEYFVQGSADERGTIRSS